MSLLHVVVGAENETKAKAAARAILDSIVAAYVALPARRIRVAKSASKNRS